MQTALPFPLKRKAAQVLASACAGALAALAIACNDGQRRDPFTVGPDGRVFEAWGCQPDETLRREGVSPAEYCQGEEPDTLYLKFSAAASERALRADRIAMKQSSCRRAARDQIAGDGLSKILGDYITATSGVSDGQSTGQAILAETRGEISGAALYDCCSLDPKTGKCAAPGAAETWEECQCVGYFRYPGGRRAFEARVEEAEARQ